jgi:two-component system sensor histidine kinase YesM
MVGTMLVVTASFLLSTYVVTINERKDFSKRESESVIATLSNNIVSEIDKYKSLSRLIMTDDSILTFLRSDVSRVDISMINDARYGIMDILNVTEGVDTVMIFREDMIMATTNRFSYKYDSDVLNGEEWKKDIYAGMGKAVISINSNGIAHKLEHKPVVTIGRAIYDIDSQKRTGILLMNISGTAFSRLLDNLNYSDICIMGEDGSFIAGNSEYVDLFEDEFLSTETTHKNVRVNKKLTLLSGARIENTPIVVMRVSPYGMAGIPHRMIYILVFLLFVIILLTACIGFYIRLNITEPIFELSNSMEKNRQCGKLDKIEVPVPNTELEMLENDYNSMIDHVNELIGKLVEKEKNLQKAEMRVLQEQIKPHFLYNSIDTIGYMAFDAGAKNVHEALETLGSFYRNFLSKGEKNIPLSREIWIVKDYLSIQKLRYGDILEDEYDISEEATSYIVPKLILQPLVENCIYHGIRPKGEKGTISIKAEVIDEKLHLSVKDTGVGMTQEQIEKIMTTQKGEEEDIDSESFGLWGTIERIRYYTGVEDVVSISSEIGEYTEIEFTIPNLSYPAGE